MVLGEDSAGLASWSGGMRAARGINCTWYELHVPRIKQNSFTVSPIRILRADFYLDLL